MKPYKPQIVIGLFFTGILLIIYAVKEIFNL